MIVYLKTSIPVFSVPSVSGQSGWDTLFHLVCCQRRNRFSTNFGWLLFAFGAAATFFKSHRQNPHRPQLVRLTGN